MEQVGLRLVRSLAVYVVMLGWMSLAAAQTESPKPASPPAAAPAAPSTPSSKAPSSTTPPTAAPVTPAPSTPGTKTPPAAEDAKPADKPAAEAPTGKPGPTEIEPNGSPGVPQNATTESVTVPARPIVTVAGKSSYEDAFKSIKASLATLKEAMEKKGLKPSGHPITIFSEPDDKGFKYKAAFPLATKPDGSPDLGNGVTIEQLPSGKAIKFQHRGAYEDIDSTYDVITAYLDAKGLQTDNPYIEEYLTELTTSDDPNLQVDIYVFVK